MAASTTNRASSRTSKPVVAPVKPVAAAKTSPKKRVRVVEPAEEEAVAAPVEAKKKGKKGTVEKKDLADKTVGEVEEIVSKDAPTPIKGALKKGKKAKEVEEVAAPEPEVEEEEIDFLKGFESADEGADSSDEEMDEGDAAEGSKSAFDTEKLPKVGKEASGVQNKLEGKDKKKSSKTGTVYLGRVPHGFHEQEMKSYFSQFGEVTRMRLSRNKKTGASKHYAFLEFAYASVAQIVQETMDNYLLAGHILVCKIVPEAEVHPKMWIGANRVFRVVPKGRRDAVARAAPKTDEQKATISARLLKREEAKRAKLVALGIDYDFSGYAEKVIAAPVEAEVKAEAPKAIKGKKEKKEKVVKEKKSSEPAKKKARKSM